MRSTLSTQDWLNIVQSVGVLFTMLYTIFHTRKSNKVTKSQILNSLYQRLDTLNLLEFNNPGIIDKFQNNYNHYNDEHSSFNSYVDIIKTFFYEMYYHHKNGLLSNDEWKSWELSIKRFFNRPYVRGYWELNKLNYSLDFNAYVDNLIRHED